MRWLQQLPAAGPVQPPRDSIRRAEEQWAEQAAYDARQAAYDARQAEAEHTGGQRLARPPARPPRPRLGVPARLNAHLRGQDQRPTHTPAAPLLCARRRHRRRVDLLNSTPPPTLPQAPSCPARPPAHSSPQPLPLPRRPAPAGTPTRTPLEGRTGRRPWRGRPSTTHCSRRPAARRPRVRLKESTISGRPCQWRLWQGGQLPCSRCAPMMH